MRVTTNAIMRQYNKRINNALTLLNKASTRVDSGFKYAKSSENPADSSKARRLYNQKLSNESYLTNLRDTVGKLDAIEDNMSTIRNTVSEACARVEYALNDPTVLDGRKVVAAELRKMQESIVSAANARMNDQYLFGGSGTQEAPFELDPDGNLLYRGLNVNDNSNKEQLDKLANEKIYVDLGFGLSFESNTNNVLSGTAFNTAMPGISFLGYGVGADGSPNNVVATLGKIADALEDPDFDSGAGSETRKLWSQLQDQFKSININITELGTDQQFLETTKTRLEDAQFSLEERINELVGIDSAQAIVEWEYQQYVYSAILKMGSSILTPSFLDYMK